MKHVFLENACIISPKTDCIYHIKNPLSPNNFITIKLNGLEIQKWQALNLSGGYFINDDQFTYFSSNNITFIPKEAIVGDYNILPWPPIVCRNDNSEQLMVIEELKVDFVNDELDFSGRGFTTGDEVKIINVPLQTEAQAEAEDIPVGVSDFPIFAPKERPTHHYLETIYQWFLKSNKHKLDEQFEFSHTKCYLRAYFVTTFLNAQGIDSQKVFEYWERPEDWANFGNNRSWYYHCATMIIDDQNQKWIWDPWVHKYPHLITLKQWLNEKNQPRPNKAMITNGAIVSDSDSGMIPESSYFTKLSLSQEMNVMQMLIKSVFVEHLQKPLAVKQPRASFATALQTMFHHAHKPGLLTKPQNFRLLFFNPPKPLKQINKKRETYCGFKPGFLITR